MQALLDETIERRLPHVQSGVTPLPARVVTWVPFLWTRVLFPARRTPSGRGGGVPCCWCCSSRRRCFIPACPSRCSSRMRAVTLRFPREMLQAGDWVVPTLHGEPYLDKPPLFYWMVMLAYTALGCHDWAARLVPAAGPARHRAADLSDGPAVGRRTYRILGRLAARGFAWVPRHGPAAPARRRLDASG